MRRSASVLVLLVACTVPWSPSADATPECQPVETVEVPAYAARGGAPFVVALGLAACAEGSYGEARAWIGNATHQASRVWDGASWVSSTSYVPLAELPLAADGQAVFAVKAHADAANAAVLIESAAEAQVYLRLRGPNGTTPPIQLGVITWMDATHTGWFDAPHGWVALRDTAGDLLTSAPSGFDGQGLPTPAGHAVVAAAPGIAGRAGPAPVAPGDVLVARFAPALDPASADFVEIRNVGGTGVPLAGLRVEDGEGTLHVALLPGLPDALPPGGILRLASANVTGVAAANGTLAWNDTHLRGPFALAKDGDTIALGYGDVWLDVVAYGAGARAPTGWTGPATEAASVERRIFVRAEDAVGPVDTDSAADWVHPRVHRQHQHDRPWVASTADEVRAFVCPDRCLEEALLRIGSATVSLDVNLYDLSHRTVVDALAAAASRGVAVRVLLDPAPVGASADKMDRIAWSVDALVDVGADVRVHERLRFAYDHAKYLVADERWTFVVSENANPSGWPPDGESGNRGWGVAVLDAVLAQWSADLFEADFSHPIDTRSVTGRDLNPDAQTPYWAPASPPVDDRIETLVVPGPVAVRPAVAPEHLGDPATNPIIQAIASARSSVRFQQLNLPLEWNRPGHSTESPLITEILFAAGRGVDVRGVLAGAFDDGDVTTAGNDRTAHILSAFMASIDVRLGDGPHPDGIVHNKGWLIDDTVIVGSANGNLASQTANREFDLVLVDARIAAYFAAVFDADHAAAANNEVPPPGPVALPGPSLALILALFAGLCRSVLIPRRARRASS